MVSIVIGIHVAVCITLCVMILLQQGKGADIGAVFGGSSQTLFGSSGAGNILTKFTSALAAVFFATSLFLAYSSTRRFTGSIMPVKRAPVTAPAAPAPANQPAIPAQKPAAPAQKK
jgi:preprotein translocase subunit SecG